MIKYSNGQYIEMTEEEINSIENQINSLSENLTPTTEERLEAVEAAILEIIFGGQSND